MKKISISFLSLCLVLSITTETGCKKKNQTESVTPVITPPPPVVAPPQLVFKNGFEGSTKIEYKGSQHDLFRGSDTTSTVSNWFDHLEKNPYFGFGQIVYEQGNDSQRKAAIVADPGNTANKVLRLRINEKHIFLPSGEVKARIQYDLQNRNVAPAGGYIKEYYQKVKIYFSPDFAVLENAGTDDIGWIIMQEFWNDPQWDAPLPGGGTKTRSQARTDVEVVRRNGKLRFGVKGRCPVNVYPATWEVVNTNFAIPLGKWITQEIYVKEGVTDGRFYLAVTVDNVKTILVDKIGMTTSNVPGYVPDGQTAWNPIKIYTEGKVIDWFKLQNKSLDIYWDDLEIWLNKRP